MWRGADLVVRAVLDGREAAKAIKQMFAAQEFEAQDTADTAATTA